MEYGKLYFINKLSIMLQSTSKERTEYHIFSPKGKLIGNFVEVRVNKIKRLYIHIDSNYLEEIDCKRLSELIKKGEGLFSPEEKKEAKEE